MKIVFISDTHGFHGKLTLPEGDVLIHCGDVSGRGMESQIVDFLDWFTQQPHKHKIMIAGNHDFYFEQNTESSIKKLIPDNVVYLNDSLVKVEGIKIWGSPISTYFYNWAFNKHKGNDIGKHWDLIPHDTDILVTHGPAWQIRDKTHSGVHVGCDLLQNKIFETKPRIHAFGHIHECYGQDLINDVNFINASVLTADYKLSNKPIVFDW